MEGIIIDLVFQFFELVKIWLPKFWKIQFGSQVLRIFNLVLLIFKVVQFNTSRYIPINVIRILVSCHCAIESWVKLLI